MSSNMRKPYKLDCIEWNDRHVRLNVFDPTGANCGTLTLPSADVLGFVLNSWKGDIFWNGLMPDEFLTMGAT